MKKTPKGLRLHIGIFGRVNAGKSSFLNMISGQDVAITSPVPGTTTDVVEKSMELLPLGPVVFLDTAGMDDNSALGAERLRRTRAALERSDIAVLVAEPDQWTSFEDELIASAGAGNTPVICAVNKNDLQPPSAEVLARLAEKKIPYFSCASVNADRRDAQLSEFKSLLLEACPEDFLNPPPLAGDLLRAGEVAVLVVPIDLQAPKGRLMLPQVQTIRDALDNDAACLIVKEREYAAALSMLKQPPGLVVCDSQVVNKVMADTPKEIKTTTFSILFARLKGDLPQMAAAAAAIDGLRSGDKVLIAESCSHHPAEDDIGRVKIPRWLKQYVGGDLTVDFACGRDYPSNLSEYRLVIHCGGCMQTRRDMLVRMEKARKAGVPITNYGVAISMLQGVLKRALSPFPAALSAFEAAHAEHKERRNTAK